MINKDMRKKFVGKRSRFLAALTLAAALAVSQVPLVYANGDTESSSAESRIFPDNITVEDPVELSEIGLPSNEYGTLSWVNDSYVPEERVQSCKVKLTPFKGVDLSWADGWDAEEGVVTGWINVVVSSIENEDSEEEDSEDTSEEETDFEEMSYEKTDEDTEESTSEDTVSDDKDTESLLEVTPEDGNIPAVTPVVSKAPGADNTKTDVSDTEGESSEESTDTEENKDTEKTEGAEDTETEEKNSSEDESVKVPSEDSTEKPVDESVPEQDSAENDKGIEENMPNENDKGTEEDISDENDKGTEEDISDENDKDTEEDMSDENDKDTEEDMSDKNENIFDNPTDFTQEDSRPADAEENLTAQEESERAQMNHSCDGIYVSGINLPWYVQFRVSSGEDYQFENESEAAIFQSYEFELWDLRNDTEYEIPDGEYISVTVPVKAGYDYTIEHLLDNGAVETIIPSVDGDTMIFSTHSFSPFGIAGSKQLVGPDFGNDTTVSVTPTPMISSSVTPSAGGSTTNAQGSSTPTGNGTQNGTQNSGNQSGTSADQNPESGNRQTADGVNSSQPSSNTSDGTANNGAVNTGDTTMILPFVILIGAAVVIIAAVIIVKKKKK